MSEGGRPTRWQKARNDWPGFQWADSAIAGVGLGLAVVVLAILGFPGETVVEVVVVAGAGIAAAVLYALGQLVWAWLQAPMRLLTADVIAIRERVEAMPGAPTPQPEPAPPNVRLNLLNFIRLGRRHLNDPTRPLIGDVELEKWTQKVIVFLNEYVSGEAAEGFVTATGATGAGAVEERIVYLEKFIKERDEVLG
jgi:hypothetical protein